VINILKITYFTATSLIDDWSDSLLLIRGRFFTSLKERTNGLIDEMTHRQNVNRAGVDVIELINTINASQAFLGFLQKEKTKIEDYEKNIDKNEFIKNLKKNIPVILSVVFGLALLFILILRILPSRKSTELSILSGGEKSLWLEKEVALFKNQGAQKFKSNLKFLGTIEAKDTLKNNKKYDIWLPANISEKNELSSLVFESKPQIIGKTPLIVVMWRGKKNYLDGKYGKEVDILEQIVREMESDPKFKIAFTDPTKSNSGQSTLSAFTYFFLSNNRHVDNNSIEDYQDLLGIDNSYPHFLSMIKKHSNTKCRTTSEILNLLLSEGNSYDSYFLYEDIFIQTVSEDNVMNVNGGISAYYSQYSLWNQYSFISFNSLDQTDIEKQIVQNFYDYLLIYETQLRFVQYGIRPNNYQVLVELKKPNSDLSKRFEELSSYGIEIEPLEKKNTSMKKETPNVEVIRYILDQWGLIK
jgi:hypothetical protein